MKSKTFSPLSLASYALVLITGVLNFSWSIADHDDGYTIAYHVFGRDAEIQRPYGPYDSMCDKLLSFLPQDYHWIYGAMITATFLSFLLCIYFLKKLTMEIAGNTEKTVDLAAILFILAMPEFLYMCFSFKSVVISLAVLLFSYYVLLRSIKKDQSSPLTLLSMLLFGLGVSLRWNHIPFGVVVAADYFYLQLQQGARTIAIKRTLFWGIGAIISAFIWIYISGYSPMDFMNTALGGKQYMEKAESQIVVRLVEASLFLLPFTIILWIIGIRRSLVIKTGRARIIVLTLAGLLSYSVLGLAPSFKYLSILWLVFFLFFAQAIDAVHENKFLRNNITILFLTVILLIPWFVGIQVEIPTSNWGPGFEIRDSIAVSRTESNKLKLNDRFKISKVSVVLGAGSAFPTSEGNRPLMGHAYTLWGGALKKFNNKMSLETDVVLEQASAKQGTVWTDRANPFFLASLCREGYFLQSKPYHEQFSTTRIYRNGKGLSVSEFRIADPKQLFHRDSIYHKFRGKTIFALFTYTSAMNKLMENMQVDSRFKINRMGPFSAKVGVDQTE